MARRRLPYADKAVLDQALLLHGEVATDTTDFRLRIGDGVSPGGIPQANLADVLIVQGNLDTVAQDLAATGDELDDVREALASGIKGYPTFSDLPTGVAAGTLGKVADTGITYRFNGSAWVEFDVPDNLVQDDPLADAHVLTDENGFVLARFGPQMAMFASILFQIDETTRGISPVDQFGFRSSYLDEAGGMIAGLIFEEDIVNPGVSIVDRHGFVLANFGGLNPEEGEPEAPPALDGTPYFTRHLCGVEGEEHPIYLRNMLTQRSDIAPVRGELSSRVNANPYCVSGDDLIQVRTDRMGTVGDLVVRTDDVSVRWRLPLTVATAPKHPTSLGSFAVLGIGDSIWNRQASAMVKAFLTDWGYSPAMVGTCLGQGYGGVPGELGEGREGWESGDYTYAVTEFSPVEPGAEATYLAMTPSEKRAFNPFIRAATGADDPADVRNGYVVDFASYQSRFSVPTPDVVVYALGTNDLRDRPAAALFDTVLDNDRLMIRRLKAAWPAVKIIRTLPGTARSASRDALWPRYLDVIRAMMTAQAETTGVFLCPAWAMATEDTGYQLATGTTDPTTGVIRAGLADDVHPTAHTRAQLFRAVAAYVACAASNQI